MKLLNLLFLLLFSVSAFAVQGDLQFRLRSKLITKAFNMGLKHFVDEKGYVKQHIPSQKFDLEVALSDYMDVEDQHYYGNKLLGLNLKGKSKVKFYFKNPFAQAKIILKDPIFTSRNDNGDLLDVKLSVEVENYYIYFKNVWFSESGLTNAETVKTDSCTKMIMDGTYHDQALLDKYQEELKDFYGNLKGSYFNEVKDKVWARIDHLQLGYREYHDRKELNDANVLKLSVTGTVDLRKGKDTLKIKKITHNIGKEAKLKIHLPADNIVVPPIFIKTTRNLVDEQGNMLKVDGVQQKEVRCTHLDLGFAKEYAASLSQDLSKQVYDLLTDDFVNGMKDKINASIKEMAIPQVPTELSVTNDKYDYKEINFAGTTMKIKKELDMDMYEDIAAIIGDFQKYRASVGLSHLSTPLYGKALVAKIDAKLAVDGDKLVYREKNARKQFPGHDEFKFGLHHDDVAFALSGKMIQKVVNLVKDRLMKTHLPSGVRVYMNEDIYKVDSKGYIVVTPKIEVEVKGYEILRFAIEVKAKPRIAYHKSDKSRKYLVVDFDVPAGKEILDSIKAGKAIRKAKAVYNIGKWVFPIYGAMSEFVYEPLLGKGLEAGKKYFGAKIDTYIKNIENNYKEFEITNLIDDYGVEPMRLEFKQSGHAALYVKVNKIMGLDDAMKSIKEKYNLN